MPSIDQINAAPQQGTDIRAQVDQELLHQQLHADQPGPNQPPPVLPAHVTTGLSRLFSQAFGEDGQAPVAIQPPTAINSCIGQYVPVITNAVNNGPNQC